MDKNKKDVKTKPVVVKGGRSLTGQPLNPIDINPQLNKKQVNEQSRGGVVLTFGRMNPPTVGHEKLAQKLVSVAHQEKATPMIFLSHSQDKKKNPLEHKDKVRFAKIAFGNIVQDSPARTLMEILKSLESKFKTATVVVGDDRVKEFTELLNKYNGKEYNFDSIKVVSAGQRDPDAEGVEGMSASKMRQAVIDKDAQQFKSGLPAKLRSRAKEVYDLIRHGMKLQEELEADELLGEALSIEQRRKRALVMRKYQTKIERARELAKKRLAPTQRLKKRAREQAIELIRRRVAGKRGMDYEKLSPSEKIQVDKAVEKRKKAIGKIAARIFPRVKAAEFQRLKTYLHSQKTPAPKVNEELNSLFEQHHSKVQPRALDDIINEMVNAVTTRVITEKEIQALEKKSEKYEIDYELLEQVFMRGLLDTVGDHQAAFNRVNAFCNGGKSAMNEDYDLYQLVEGRAPGKPSVTRYTRPDGSTALKSLNKWGKRKDWRDTEGGMAMAKKHAGIDEAFTKASEARKKIEKVDRKPPHTEHGKQSEIEKKIIDEGLKDPKDNPCWDNYKPVGTKKKNGKTVPNCVPEDVAFENFMNGKGPGKPGDAARHGLKGKSAAELRKIRSSDSASPRKKQLAHWMLNMHHNESVEKVEGTNCRNCSWWKKDSEKPVTKEELNKNGGLKAPNDEYIAMSKRIDLGTLPGEDHNVKVKGFCDHKEINDWVTERMCCSQWDADGMIRDYKGHSPVMKESLDESFKIAYGAGIGVTMTAADLGIKAQGGFAYHPSVMPQEELVDEEVKSGDKEPVVVPAHKDEYGNTIPAKTVMRKRNKVIVHSGDNPSDGK